MKYFLMNIGCAMNQADAERIQSVFNGMDMTKTDKEEDADILGIVACSVRQKAIDKVYHKIHEWNTWKTNRSILTFVSGCILPDDKVKFLKKFDLLFHMKDLPQVPDMIRQYGIVTPLAGKIQPPKDSMNESNETNGAQDYFSQIAPTYTSTFEAFIPIQNGCDKFCTFCAVPYTRGKEVSRSSADILAEVEKLVLADYKSITLLGQNVNSYGLDKPGEEISFSKLLEEIGEIGKRSGKNFWTYFTSPHPRDMTKEVLTTIAKYPVLAKQIHLPLQSGDDKVLIKMNRNHNMDRYRDIMNQIRTILPEASISTDFIVGFTGETEEQFNRSLAAMQEFRYQMAYISPYSPRPGAASSSWADDVPHVEKKRRFHVLTQALEETSLEYNQRFIGKTIPVLVERADRKLGYLSGRTEGKVLVRFASEDQTLIGQFVNLHITSAVPYSMEGDLQSAC
jgi:tRNA-2-methylthio-N6-dimethylallyladenosine synthase